MLGVKAALGGLFLLMGRELNFLFAGTFAAFIAIRVAPLLPATWPAWSHIAFIVGVAGVVAAITSLNKHAGYALSGFLVGGYYLAEYTAPNFVAIPTLPFLIGGVTGAIIMGVLTEWALMIVSSLIGALFLMELFKLSPIMEKMITGALFMAGALTQVVIRRMQQK